MSGFPGTKGDAEHAAPAGEGPTDFATARSRESAGTTVVVEAAGEPDSLIPRMIALLSAPSAAGAEVLVACPRPLRRTLEEAAGSRFRNVSVVPLAGEHPEEDSERVLRRVRTDKVAFLPAGGSTSAPVFTALPEGERSAAILLDAAPPAGRPAQKPNARDFGWLASTKLLRDLPALRFPDDWNLVRLEARWRERGWAVTWPSARSTSVAEARVRTAGRGPVLNTESSVLALIPHYRCEEWLESSIRSLVGQTRPPDGIVVIDDASEVPPTEVVGKFPQVTLLIAGETVGPYCLKQAVIAATDYDAYLLQDADDWSSNSRLELLLAEAERTGAEIVGSQEIRFYCDRGEVIPIQYPSDVNAALALQEPECDPLLHPACLLSREIMKRLGGFATGLRFGGDAEFLMRATYAARMVNIPFYGYFRRRRADSLTTSPETGIHSQARIELRRALDLRGDANLEAVARGEAPDLKPAPLAGPVKLTHLLGPRLRAARGGGLA